MQYRRLFKADDDFHPADRPPEQRDNWLVGKEWYEQGDRVRSNRDPQAARPQEPADLLLQPGQVADELRRGDRRRRLLRQGPPRLDQTAAEEWRQFGEVPIEHSTGVKLQLGDKAQAGERSGRS